MPLNRLNVIQSFDYFSRLEKPSITLCNPDRTEIYSLNACNNTNLKLRWNSQSEFSFDFPKFINGIQMDAYDYIEGKRVVKIENIGYFIIVDVEDNSDGSSPIKSVNCVSQDAELVYKKVTLFSGTYSFNDLLQAVLALSPGWSLGYIDSSLTSLYRTFNVSDSNVYQFLTSDVSVAFDCVFVFDYVDKNISAIPSTYTPDETILFLSFDNLIRHTNYREISDEICTCLHCYGGNNLTIRNVNPLGTTAIYNFDYYKTTEWMTQDLIDAIDAWELKVSGCTQPYSDLLIDLSNANALLLEQQAQLAEYQTELASDQQVRAARVAQGLDTTEIDAQIVVDEQNVLDQNNLITQTNETISDITDQLSSINDELSLLNEINFSSELFSELSNFIFENSYRNDNIITTDSMTFSEIQEQSRQLYNVATTVLEKMAIPRYQISIDSVNFLAIPEFSPFVEQFTLGDQITVDTGRGFFIDATLLEYEFSYDDMNVFTITLSNRQRLDNSHFIFTDLFGQNVQASNNINFNSASWNDWTTSKPTVLNNVLTPTGTYSYGIIAENIKGTIRATSDLAITNINSNTGSSNFSLDSNGVVIRDGTFYAGSNVGIDGNLSLRGGGAIFFGKGLFLGAAGLEPGSNVITTENLTSQVSGGSYFTISGSFLSNSLWVFLNGLEQVKGFNFEENSNVTSFIMYDIPVVGDILIVKYVDLSG